MTPDPTPAVTSVKMKKLHSQERHQFKDLFTQEKIDRFDDRFRILGEFLKTEGHITVPELARELEAQGLDFDESFVADTLELFCRFGFAHEVRFKNGAVRYEHRHLGQHHDHMICTRCGRIIEFENPQLEDLQLQIARGHGFHLLQHKMDLYGICSRCLARRVPQMPLAMAKPGERLVVEGFTGGGGARMRLLAMGFRVGDTLEVITQHGDGQMVVAMDGRRYALGPGLAHKIIVKSS